MHCPHCDQEHADELRFCPMTGHALAPLEHARPVQAESEDAPAVAEGPVDEIEQLISNLSSSEYLAKLNAAFDLGQLKDKRAVEPLRQALQDPDPNIRHAASEALEKIGGVHAQEVLSEARKVTEKDKVQPSQHFEVCLRMGETQIFDSAQALGEEIVRGALPKSLQARTVTVNQNGKKTESKWTTVEKIAASQEQIRSLYRPIWHHTLKFLMYGVIAGFALKALDTTVILFATDITAGIVWLLAVGSLLVSGKWPYAPMVIIIGSVLLGFRMNFFMTVLAVMAIGAIFGAPVGMIAGTIVGRLRKGTWRLAPDAEPEGLRPYLLGIVLPLVILAVAVPLYLWLNVKILQWLA